MKATLERIDELVEVALNLWPEHDLEDIKGVLSKYIEGEETSLFMRLENNKCVGIALVSLRHDYVEGCSTSPVGYLEGICVNKEYRNKGIATKLVKECEQWSKEKGCKEFASDCELSNDVSYSFHQKNGFEEVNRIIHFWKKL